MKKINVLSLFDGISCGQVALERAGIPVENYFASEIDKNAIAVTQKNYPNTVQLGDVVKVSAQDLPKIDLLTGGFCCQSFSLSGKQLNFEDPRGKLFFECVRLLNELRVSNPNIFFLFENVKMKKQYQDFISQELGVEPIKINSSLVSAQNRERLYWTNIPNVQQPEDKKLLVKDILEESADGHFSDGFYVVPRGTNNGGLKHYKGKSPTITTSSWRYNFYACQKIEENLYELLKTSKYKNDFKWKFDKMGRILVERPDGLKIQRIGRISSSDNKSEILTCVTQPHVNDGLLLRKVSPLEAERLQTLPENYTNVGISDNQRFHAIGNGWTVDVIAHIFSFLKEELSKDENPV